MILGPTEKILAGGGLTEEQRRGLEVVDRNARTLLKHVTDLLDIAKLDARKMTVNFAAVDLVKLLRATAAYFESLGVKAENIFWSDYTNEQLYKEGAKRGAIDPCFPSKLGIPHVHNLLYVVHAKKPLDIIFFPMIDCLTTDLHNVQASRSCPTPRRRCG